MRWRFWVKDESEGPIPESPEPPNGEIARIRHRIQDADEKLKETRRQETALDRTVGKYRRVVDNYTDELDATFRRARREGP